uniref:Uncharacterized protein n=1 Tax=Chromera velia CCMP2878 TaxID=1169474 RepID=A0A0G4FYJ3_9ALVE|eukprot:Cvel_19380.t1-p1 / transcript=Cvel_19380.t1 / gene=Cvel_19380 / organism=Chromera_velia_CCMP2878 / gene_product=hypothetical protein / transcript_product=hypothetical protein / location=Cvel_scaffold1666:36839-37252(-) / protein_length=138 / sequence_SO=supercontig / SO=protein_coding / is_pseudo=false
MTLIDLARQMSKGGGECARSFNFVLNDIHPVVIARLLLAIQLSQTLAESAETPEDLQTDSSAKDVAICLQYLFASTLFPPRIYTEVFLPAVAGAIEAAEAQLSLLEGGKERSPGWKASLSGRPDTTQCSLKMERVAGG